MHQSPLQYQILCIRFLPYLDIPSILSERAHHCLPVNSDGKNVSIAHPWLCYPKIRELVQLRMATMRNTRANKWNCIFVLLKLVNHGPIYYRNHNCHLAVSPKIALMSPSIAFTNDLTSDTKTTTYCAFGPQIAWSLLVLGLYWRYLGERYAMRTMKKLLKEAEPGMQHLVRREWRTDRLC